MDKKNYPPLETSTVLTEDEMNNTLGGKGCKHGCREGCYEGCQAGMRTCGGFPEEILMQ